MNHKAHTITLTTKLKVLDMIAESGKYKVAKAAKKNKRDAIEVPVAEKKLEVINGDEPADAADDEKQKECTEQETEVDQAKYPEVEQCEKKKKITIKEWFKFHAKRLELTRKTKDENVVRSEEAAATAHASFKDAEEQQSKIRKPIEDNKAEEEPEEDEKPKDDEVKESVEEKPEKEELPIDEKQELPIAEKEAELSKDDIDKPKESKALRKE